MTWRDVACAALALLLAACAQAPPPPLTQEAYVWQRQWTASLRAALLDARDPFSAYRVLALEGDAHGALRRVGVDAAALARSGGATLVVRLPGVYPQVDPAQLAAELAAIAAQWRAAGVTVRGVEVDHDCATARLRDYEKFLRAVRGALPRDLALSITALPTWLDDGDIAPLLAVADSSVLQLHAVRNPNRGLFDAAAAERWTRRYAGRTSRPFAVALPAYGSRVGFDADDQPVGVESEMPRAVGGVRSAELRVAPQDVAAYLTRLDARPPPHLAGIVWFRLPLPEDARAWSLATLRAVVHGAPLTPRYTARLDGVDLRVANVGAIDAPLPDLVVRASECLAADGAGGYRAQSSAEGWRFAAPADRILRAGRESPAGWLRCTHVDKVEIDASP